MIGGPSQREVEGVSNEELANVSDVNPSASVYIRDATRIYVVGDASECTRYVVPQKKTNTFVVIQE